MGTKPLTVNQAKLLRNILTSQYWDGAPIADRIGAMTWTFDVIDNFAKEARGGIVAKAQEAGLINVYLVTAKGRKAGDDDTIGITQLGYDSLMAHEAAATVTSSCGCAPGYNCIHRRIESIEAAPAGDTTAAQVAQSEASKTPTAEKFITLQSVSNERPICITFYKDGTATLYGSPTIEASSPADLSAKAVTGYKGRDLGIIRKWITILSR